MSQSIDNPTTVSALTKRIKGLLEGGFRNIAVEGELSNSKLHSSGHFYFTLKDEQSQIQGVMWRSRVAGLSFAPQDGMRVVVAGHVTVYEVRGVYQIDALRITSAGVGELQMAFERLKAKLSAEGLFSMERKKPLPKIPGRIGIITSPTGAAVRDMITVIGRRFPAAQIVLVPVRVQGAGSAGEIADAIRDCNRFDGFDVLIVGRGGGSIEDLWAFNEEAVARAIAGSGVPIVSAVGHETDVTIADFVADLRAPTPSAAAELVVPNAGELVEILRNFQYTVFQRIRETIGSLRKHVNSLVGSYVFNKPLDRIRQQFQQRDDLHRALEKATQGMLGSLRQRLDGIIEQLRVLNPDQVLRRGYAVVERDGDIVTRAAQLVQHEQVALRFHDGRKSAVITTDNE